MLAAATISTQTGVKDSRFGRKAGSEESGRMDDGSSTAVVCCHHPLSFLGTRWDFSSLQAGRAVSLVDHPRCRSLLDHHGRFENREWDRTEWPKANTF